MLIIVVILDQLSYDEFNAKKDRIFRIQLIDSHTDVGLKFAAAPYPLAGELLNNYSFFDKVVELTGLLTITSQTFRAARTNPVNTLKYE
jgi:hypothetical protein